MKILLSDSFDASLPDRLRKFGEVTDDKAQLATAEVVLIRSATKATAEYIASAPKLKMIIRGGVGLDNVDVPAAEARGIKVFNTAAASSIAVAELAFAFLLAIPSRLIDGHVSMQGGKFLKKELKRTELYGKTLGIVGVGRIGTEVAKRAAAFGMTCVGFDPVVTRHDLVTMTTLNDLCARADYISFNTPLNDSTKGMVNAALIDRMKNGVVLVNTGRGKIIVEADLATALESGKVGAYGTDVWESDPPPESSPLLKAKNVYMCPHIGASTKENLLRIGDVIVEILGREYGK
jgi:phosphoglycerate dehydrogenase-like enzyme